MTTKKSTSIKILEIEQGSHCENFLLQKTGVKYFIDIAELFPSSVKFKSETDMPSIGCAWYTEAESGHMQLYKSNWDQS